ncbi:MAG: hypothetical protein QOK28_1900, partial [Actinomycetota bacterium]
MFIVFAVLGCSAALLTSAVVDRVGPLARPEFHLVTSLPLAVYPVAIIGVVALVLARKTWWAGLALFFAWLPFEDLVRKYANNDLRVYFVKDVLLALALITVVPKLGGCWRRPLGGLWLPTLLVFSVAVVYSIPSAITHPSVALIGLHQKFAFAALFP